MTRAVRAQVQPFKLFTAVLKQCFDISQTQKRHRINLWRYEFASNFVAWSILRAPMAHSWGISGAFLSSSKFSRWGLPGVRAFVVVPVEFSSVFWKQRHVALSSDKGALVLDAFNTCFGYFGRFQLIYNSPRSHGHQGRINLLLDYNRRQNVWDIVRK